MIKYNYGSSRGNKVWIGGFVEESKFKRITIAIELNKDKFKSKINWIIKQYKNGETDITYEEFKKKYNNDIIKEAYEFAEDKGYLKRWE